MIFACTWAGVVRNFCNSVMQCNDCNVMCLTLMLVSEEGMDSADHAGFTVTTTSDSMPQPGIFTWRL